MVLFAFAKRMNFTIIADNLKKLMKAYSVGAKTGYMKPCKKERSVFFERLAQQPSQALVSLGEQSLLNNAF